MNSYVQKLRLKHDPFDDEFQRDDFFAGGSRENLVLKVLDPDRRNISLDAVIGQAGSGKTRLAFRICERARGKCESALVSVDLFTTALYLLREIMLELDLEAPRDLARGLEELSEHAIELSKSDRSILLVIDNAQELGSDCMKLIERLLANRWSAIHLVLLGQEQLADMLQTRMRDRYRKKLAMHELTALNRVEIAEYLRLKLSRAGYRVELSLSSQAGLDLLQQSEGVPGRVNALAAEMLNSEDFPGVARGFGKRREGDHPEIRYFWQAFALGLVLVGVIFWPTDSPELSASLEEEAREIQRISLSATVSPATSNTIEPARVGAGQLPGGAMDISDTAAPVAPSVVATPELSAFERMLLGTPTDSFTLQIVGSTSEEGVREFIAESRLGEIHGYYETRRERAPWFVVVDGIYPDWETAMEARAGLAGKFGELEPWIRRISNVHSEISRSGKQGEP